MKLIFLGSGPMKPVIGKGRDNRRNSSLLLTTRTGLNILVDCSPQFFEQMNTFADHINRIDYIFITHAHHDSIGGLPQLKYWLKEKKQQDKPILLVEKETENRINETFKDIYAEIKNFSPYQIINLGHIKVVPFRVIHAEGSITGHKYPTVGFRIDNKIIYAEDTEKIPDKSIPYFDNSEVIIVDSTMWFNGKLRGHMSVQNSLDFVKKLNTKKVILIQAGHSYPTYVHAMKEIGEYWKKINGNIKTDVQLAYDGLTLNIQDQFQKIDDYLIEVREGICLNSPHAQFINDGKKRVIIQPKRYNQMIDKLIYFMDNQYAYGILKLKNPSMIDLSDFEKYKSSHLVSSEERRKLWGNKRYLFMYPFDVIERFSEPRKIRINENQVFTEVKFMEELSPIELVEDVNAYNPENINNQNLAEDWKNICSWFTTKKNDENFRYPMDTIVKLAKSIYNEITKRKNRGDMKYEFNETPFVKELRQSIIDIDFPKEPQKELAIPEGIKEMADTTTAHITGLQPTFWTTGKKVKVGDRFGVIKDIKQEKSYLVQFDDVDEVVKEKELQSVDFVPMSSFIPLKGTEIDGQTLFSDMEKAIEVLSPSEANIYFVEEKFGGKRCILHKNGEEIKVFSDENKELNDTPFIIEQAKELTAENIILDGKIVLYDNEAKYHVFDILYYKDQSLGDMRLYERKKVLSLLNFTKNIAKVPWVVANDKETLEKAIKMNSELPNSEGAIIRGYNSTYPSFGENPQWISFSLNKTERAE